MRDVEQDLRATGEAVSADAERLTAIEAEKATLAPDDPRLEPLSVEAQAIAERLRVGTLAERQLAELGRKLA